MTSIAVRHTVTGPKDAPVLVLSNSLGSTFAMWNLQADVLADHFRLVRYDIRGHGGSPVPPGPYDLADLGADALALLDHLQIERAHFAGLSLGGMTGMWLGIHAPERIDRLVLMCTSAQLGPPETWSERAALVRAKGTGAVAPGGVERWLTAGYRSAHPEVAADLEAMIASIDPEGYAGACAAIETMDLTSDLGRITAPTLVIAGRQDPATPPEHAERIVAGIPDARLHVLDPAAHLANVEQPDKSTKLIVEHLEA
jgi:3-oxoadipate enol-lactonase